MKVCFSNLFLLTKYFPYFLFKISTIDEVMTKGNSGRSLLRSKAPDLNRMVLYSVVNVTVGGTGDSGEFDWVRLTL